MRLCRFSTSRTTPRAVVAQFGSDGCVLLLKKSMKDMLDVVGRTKGKGILPCVDRGCVGLLAQVRGSGGVRAARLGRIIPMANIRNT